MIADEHLSGQYGFLNRLLFYFLLCFSIMVRKTLWLSGAALGVAMTYSSCAAVSTLSVLTFSQSESLASPEKCPLARILLADN